MRKIFLFFLAILNLSCSGFFDGLGNSIGGDSFRRKTPKMSGYSEKDLAVALENQNLDSAVVAEAIRELSARDEGKLNALSQSQKMTLATRLVDALLPLSSFSELAKSLDDESEDKAILEKVVSIIRHSRDSSVGILAMKLLTEDFVNTGDEICVNLIALTVLIDGIADAPTEGTTVQVITDALSGKFSDADDVELKKVLDSEIWDLSGPRPVIKEGATRHDCMDNTRDVAELVIDAASSDADEATKAKMTLALSALLLADGVSGMSPFEVLGALAV